MLLGPLLAQYEEELIAVGEEAESLSFAYRALNNWTFTDFVLALQKEVEEEEIEIPQSGEEATTSLGSLFANIKLN